MIELNKLNIKDSPLYIKPKKEKSYYIGMGILAVVVIILGIVGVVVANISANTIIKQETEINRLNNKVEQQIELIDSLKQIN